MRVRYNRFNTENIFITFKQENILKYYLTYFQLVYKNYISTKH